MKVLHITHDYPFSQLYPKLFETMLLFTPLKVVVPLPEKADVSIVGNNVVPLHCLKRSRLSFWYNQKIQYKAALEVLDVHTFDICHAHYLIGDGGLARRLKKSLSIPYIVTVRGSCLNSLSKWNKPHLYIYGITTMFKADTVVFLSPSYKEQVINKHIPWFLRKWITAKSIVIPNGIEQFWFDNIYKAPRSVSRGNLKILTVGDIDRNKNHQAVIRAIEKLEIKGYKVKYTIIGEVHDKLVFEKIIKSPFVQYLPKMAKEELLIEYRNADLFVLTSISETFGLVYPEAMTQGLPVVYSKGQGFDGQFMEGKAGYHAKSDSPSEICSSIEKVLENYEDISSQVSHLANKFNWLKICEEYVDLYQSIMGNISCQ